MCINGVSYKLWASMTCLEPDENISGAGPDGRQYLMGNILGMYRPVRNQLDAEQAASAVDLKQELSRKQRTIERFCPTCFVLLGPLYSLYEAREKWESSHYVLAMNRHDRIP